MASRTKVLVPAEENARINRNVLVGLSRYPDLPAEVDKIAYEYLVPDVPNMAMSVIQAPYMVRRYLCGGYEAELQFKVIYRLKPPGTSIDARLKADEELDKLAQWACGYFQENGIGVGTVRIAEITSRASLFGRYENGDEDHQVLMRINYEVI